ncbi:hypothetical protein FisN_13Lh106 [Fistulifera solaris]|uniref:Helicase-associated domain-containing protein n=1 Tax=Fistulifera solaris TaxID=1519565 RepID=A0A1Z5JFV8_FISSO|nr:hypothetical protein FisN_13Lh106 [Fistulifera solaris]|eukprot:GAX12638.1 hypothetical protein FisN_13Lh106 [Fistulifera solaris]
MNSLMESLHPASNEQSSMALEHAQARQQSLLGGIVGNSNLWGGFQNGDLLINNTSSFSSGLIDGLQSDGSLLANSRYGNSAENTLLNNMVSMQTNVFLESARNGVSGSSRSSFVGSMRNNIFGSMRDSLALGSITPLTNRATLIEGVDVDANHGAYLLSDFGSLFKPNAGDSKNEADYKDSTFTKHMLPQNVHSAQHANRISSLVSDRKLPSEPLRTVTSGSTQQNLTSRVDRSIKHTEEEDDDDDDDDEDGDGSNRFKPFHEEKWTLRYKELLAFHAQYGHAAVPHTYPPNPQLARWVKRQRRQYKLREDGKSTTMTAERLEMLSSVGFIWDSHDVNWREKLYSLTVFRQEAGNCNVPSNFKDKKLATWVKCQRRQYKLYCDGKPSAMNPDRIKVLESVGFEWEIRSNNSRRQLPSGAANGEDMSPFEV